MLKNIDLVFLGIVPSCMTYKYMKIHTYNNLRRVFRLGIPFDSVWTETTKQYPEDQKEEA